jgi:hypothetical protein
LRPRSPRPDPNKRNGADQYPHQVERDHRHGAVPPGIDHEPRAAEDVDPLKHTGLAVQRAERDQQLAKQDQPRAAPSGNLDQDRNGARRSVH